MVQDEHLTRGNVRQMSSTRKHRFAALGQTVQAKDAEGRESVLITVLFWPHPSQRETHVAATATIQVVTGGMVAETSSGTISSAAAKKFLRKFQRNNLFLQRPQKKFSINFFAERDFQRRTYWAPFRPKHKGGEAVEPLRRNKACCDGAEAIIRIKTTLRRVGVVVCDSNAILRRVTLEVMHACSES